MEKGQGTGPGIEWPAIAAAVGLTLLLLLLSSGVFCLFPLLLLAWRRGSKDALIGLALTWLLAVAFAIGVAQEGHPWSLALDIGMVTVFALSGLTFGAAILQGRDLSFAGLAAIVPWVLLSGLLLIGAIRTDRPAVEVAWTQAALEPLNAAFESFESEGADEEVVEQVSELRKLLEEDPLKPLYVFPGLLGGLLLFTLWVNLTIVRAVEPYFAGIPKLSEWRPPESLFWGLLLSLACVLVGMSSEQVGAVLLLGLNLLMVTGGVYFLAGLSVMVYGALRMGLSPLLLALVLVLLAFSGGLPFLILVGAFDFWLDFRQRWSKRDDSDLPLDS